MASRKSEAYWSESLQRWQVKVQVDGQRKTFVSSKKNSQPNNKKGKIEAEKKADAWLEDRTADEKIRVEKAFAKFIASLKMTGTRDYYRKYEEYGRNWINPIIGTKRVRSLTKNDLQNVINNAFQKGHLAAKTLSNIRACLIAFINYCRNDNLTTFHPEKLTIPATAKRSEKTIVDPNDLKVLFTSSKSTFKGKIIDDPYINAYRFAVLTGIRPGELIALRRRDIKGNKVTIMQSINDSGELTQGKNENARRVFKLGELALLVLLDQNDLLKKLNIDSEYVFPARDGDHMSQKQFRSAWKRYCDANNFTKYVTPYELRHTFVSINDEMPLALKKMVVGHSKSMDTEGVYGHRKQGDMDRAAVYIDAAFMKYLK